MENKTANQLTDRIQGHAVQDKMMADRLIGPGIFAPFSDGWLILLMTLTGLTAQVSTHPRAL